MRGVPSLWPYSPLGPAFTAQRLKSEFSVAIAPGQVSFPSPRALSLSLWNSIASSPPTRSVARTPPSTKGNVPPSTHPPAIFLPKIPAARALGGTREPVAIAGTADLGLLLLGRRKRQTGSLRARSTCLALATHPLTLCKPNCPPPKKTPTTFFFQTSHKASINLRS